MSVPFTRKLKRIYDLLTRTSSTAADAAFLAALPDLDPALQAEALDRLIKRANREGLVPLVTRFDTFDGNLQRLILDRVEHLFEAVRVAASSEREADRMGCIKLIRASRNYKLAYLLTGMLSRRCAHTMKAAADALLEMAGDALTDYQYAMDTGQQATVQRDRVRDVAEALARALESWHAHFRAEVLTASLWLCTFTEEILFKQSASTRTRLARAINSTVRGTLSPRLAAFSLRALAHSELRPNTAKAIAANTGADFVKSLLNESWVLLDPSIANACLWVHDAGWYERHFDIAGALDERSAAHAVRFLAQSGVAKDNKLAIYKRMLRLQHGPLSEAALWQVVETSGDESTRILQEVARWTDRTLSRIAEIELLHRSADVPEHKAVDLSVESPDRAAAEDFNALWQRFDMLDPETRRCELEAIIDASPKVHDWVRERLAANEPDDRLKALGFVKAAGVIEPFEERIYALSHDGSTCVRSAAIALLADVRNNVTTRILRQALNDPDRRVRANAVESAESADTTEWIEHLKGMLNDEDNRVRANTVKALLPHQVREAAVTLLDMLDDDEALNRLSALWVVEQLNLTTMANRLRNMALDDPDDRIRERSREILASHARGGTVNTDPGKVSAS